MMRRRCLGTRKAVRIVLILSLLVLLSSHYFGRSTYLTTYQHEFKRILKSTTTPELHREAYKRNIPASDSIEEYGMKRSSLLEPQPSTGTKLEEFQYSWPYSAECGFIAVETRGRLGNQMFIYASLYGLARKSKKVPVLCNPPRMLKTFNKLTIQYLTNSKNCTADIPNAVQRSERKPSAFSIKPEKLKCGTNYRIRNSYLQSYLYFDSYQEEIVREFNFSSSIRSECNSVFSQILWNSSTPNESNPEQDCIIIGVHLRRGYVTRENLIEYGYNPATRAFWHRATLYYRDHFRNSTKCLRFIVAGDDHQWNLKNRPTFETGGKDVIILKPNSPAVDFCILTKCDHSVNSVGTFGFWASYMSGGMTVYSRDFAVPGSTLFNQFVENEFFLTHWKSL